MVHKWYKCTINKRITKRNNDEFIEKKNRYNKVYYNGFTIDAISLFIADYFPMQKVFVKYNSLNNNIINTYLLLLGDRMGTKNDIQNAKMNKCIYRFLSSLSIGVNYVLGRGCYFLILF